MFPFLPRVKLGQHNLESSKCLFALQYYLIITLYRIHAQQSTYAAVANRQITLESIAKYELSESFEFSYQSTTHIYAVTQQKYKLSANYYISFYYVLF